MSETKNVIYALTDPRDDSVRYIGLSTKGTSRLKQHLSQIREKQNKEIEV